VDGSNINEIDSLLKNLPDQIWRTIEGTWSASTAWPEFINAMQVIIPLGDTEGNNGKQDSSKWAVLPGLCCQSAGGQAEWANNISAAWLLFYIAADIMDTVEDLDQPDAWWQEFGPGTAVNMASGLYFTATRILDRLYHEQPTREAAAEIIEKLIDGFLIMCSGQHIDLSQDRFTLDEYWAISAAKSGQFFGMACWAGARIDNADTVKLDCYQDFGKHLGLLIQLLDDLEEFENLHNLNSELEWRNLQKSLPVIYTLEVVPDPVKTRFIECMKRAHQDPQAVDEVVQIMEECGVVLYLVAEIERISTSALSSLSSAGPEKNASQYLVRMVTHLKTRN
jgi:geranylgeranyl pyrophosphate synthase